MLDLKTLKCEACQTGAPILTEEQIKQFMELIPLWNIVEQESIKKLERMFTFKDFKQTLSFVNRIGEIAEENGHHPLLLVGYNQLIVWWWTHKINGLHQNDFIMAAKIDGLVV
ncbi:MAG: 4a-hydroxytetrahydrobiopterin dehydratase [Candidatus Omnitrophica bacterium]|nr:4a-hydroxytetrahydrobiopterin dehydratase [Candidatus Omnitrophota bacterium]